MSRRRKKKNNVLLSETLGKVCLNDGGLLGFTEVSGSMLGREEGVVRTLALVRVLDGQEQVFDALRLCIDTLVQGNDFRRVASAGSEVFDAFRHAVVAEVVEVFVALDECAEEEIVKCFAFFEGESLSHDRNP